MSISRSPLLLAFLLCFLFACSDGDETGPSDHTATLTGVAYRITEDQPAVGAFILLSRQGVSRSEAIPDGKPVMEDGHPSSQLFQYWMTAEDGSFSIDLFLGEWPWPYSRTYVWKEGFELWSAAEHTSFIRHEAPYADYVSIYLTPVVSELER